MKTYEKPMKTSDLVVFCPFCRRNTSPPRSANYSPLQARTREAQPGRTAERAASATLPGAVPAVPGMPAVTCGEDSIHW